MLRGLEALLQQLLAAPLPHQPEQLLLHARALEAFGRVLAAEPSAVLAVIQRVRAHPTMLIACLRRHIQEAAL